MISSEESQLKFDPAGAAARRKKKKDKREKRAVAKLPFISLAQKRIIIFEPPFVYSLNFASQYTNQHDR